MATQADLEARIEQLKAGLGSSELRITYDGKTVEYRSVSEIRQALAATQAELDALTGTPRRKVYYTDSPRQKGWA